MTTTPLPYSYFKGKQQGSVYIFNKDDNLSNSETEAYQLKAVRSRNKKEDVSGSAVPEAHDTISHVVTPSDTLQSLSLKYHCKVSDLKRINHIWNSNELSARDNILIPVQKHSFLLESHDNQHHAEPITKEHRVRDKSKSPLAPGPKPVDIRTISIKSHGDNIDTRAFLERMNKDIDALLRETRDKTRKSSLSEVKTALTVERIFPKQVSSSRSGLSYSSIAGITVLFCCVFIGLPALLVLYWENVTMLVKNLGH